ncbi:MAG TPA: purine-nucleoside phosphorylase [Saprospiraceae bacterium]|nr:purine-nucleoside phosphorylase [Saprospiraceae bacterium]
MESIFEKAKESALYIKDRISITPDYAIILGTGLGGLSKNIEGAQTIHYHEIPHFPASTVQSHKGAWIAGKIGDKVVVILSGRFHFYEGYSGAQIGFPIRVLKMLGVRGIIITNVSGGLNPHYKPGQIVMVKDHINLIPDNPLRGINDERLGVRFPDMKKAYDPYFMDIARKSAKGLSCPLEEGVYIGFQGPNLETPSEYVFLRKAGGDMVGMSTVPEVITARHAEIPVLVFSMISNVCFPVESIQETTVEDVIAVAEENAHILQKLIVSVLESLP